MSDLVSLREESQRLGRERDEIENRLRKFDPRQNTRGRRGETHFRRENNEPRPNKRQRSEPEANRGGGPKLLSSIAVVRSEGEIGCDNDRWQTGDESQKPLQEAYMKPVTIQRNKRMFGALMGHLSSAQKTLQLDSELIEKQDNRKVLAAQKNSMESQRVAKLHKVLTREQKDKELDLRDAVIAQQQKLEIMIATSAWKEQQKKLEKYLLTVCEPRLAWLPGKPSVVTETMINSRAEEIAEAISKREVQDEEKISRIESDLAAKEERRRNEREKLKEQAQESGEQEDTGVVEESAKSPQDDKVGEYDDDNENDDDDILAALDGRQNA